MNKKLLAILLSFLLVASIFSGCNNTDNEKTENEAEEKQVENENTEEQKDEEKDSAEKLDDDQYINTFMDMWPSSLDPSKGNDTYGYTVIQNTLEPLIRYLENDFVPAGAESWEVSDDKMTYTFHIRKDNKWTDGKTVTAQDYAYGIKRSIDQNTASPYANLIYPILNAQEINAGKKDMSELGIETPDDYTLIIKLGTPTPYFLDLVAQRVYYPQREDYVEKYGDQYSTDIENMPVCGPFVIDNMLINSEINFVKNENFWNKENVKLEKIHMVILNDPNTINNALMTGEIDFSGSVRETKIREELEASGEYNTVVRENPWTGFFSMNFGKNSKVANTKITRAISAVINREEVIQNAWDGTGKPAWCLVSPTMKCQGKDFNTDGEGPVKDLVNDLKDPKELFREGVKEMGGDPDNYTIKLIGSDTSNSGRIAIESFQQQIEKSLGCKVDAQNLDWNAFYSLVMTQDYDIAWAGWGAEFNDPSCLLRITYSKAPGLPLGWVNEEFDKLIEDAQKETNIDERINILKKAEHIMLYDDAVIVPINYGVSYIFRRKYVQGATDSFFSTMGFQTIYTVGR